MEIPLRRLLDSQSYSLLMAVSGADGAKSPPGAASVVHYWLEQFMDNPTTFALKASWQYEALKGIDPSCDRFDVYSVWLEVSCQDLAHDCQGFFFGTRATAWTSEELCSIPRHFDFEPGHGDLLADILASNSRDDIELHLAQWDWNYQYLVVGEDQPGKRKRRPVPARTRFEVLHRAGHTCQSCGAKASDGAQLHIDHIHPVSKGGTNDISNLQALCRDCNLGKGDRIL